ncbi:hypothetical protein P4B35_01940 [Pontiellaceae bacterium B12227]|nr:hypothetical protein [Pontiellaceae bacterium B12227]
MKPIQPLIAVLVIQCGVFGMSGFADDCALDADGTVIHYDRFNTLIGEVGIEKGVDPVNGRNHITFSYRGAGVYAPAIRLGEDGVEQTNFNLLHLKFRLDGAVEQFKEMHLRLQKTGSDDFSESVNLSQYTVSGKDADGFYNCMIPLDYFLCPVDRVTHAYLFCNTYGTRERVAAIDFELAGIAFRQVADIECYYADFRKPRLNLSLSQRILAVKKASYEGVAKNDTHMGDGYSGRELFELQQELRLLVHKNFKKAPAKRELEILKLLLYGDPERDISWEKTRERIDTKSRKKEKGAELFYDGYAVYKNVLRYRATGDLRNLECAMVEADYVMSDYRNDRDEAAYFDEVIANNGTLGLGRGFSGVCEVIIEIMKSPKLQKKTAPAMMGRETYLEKAQSWMPRVIQVTEGHLKKGEYQNGKWLEGDGMAINRFLYYLHFLMAASDAAIALDSAEYGEWSEKNDRMAKEIAAFFQGECLLTGDRLRACKRVSMPWDETQQVFTSPYGPYVIWAYAYDRENTEDFAHIQMDVEAIDSVLELDPTILTEDFKTKMATMLLISAFNMETGGMQRDIGPNVPGKDPSVFPSWHLHYVPEYGRYIGKYGSDKAYADFMDYQLEVWDAQLIEGQLGRFSQYPMPREVVEARLFKYNAKTTFPRGY